MTAEQFDAMIERMALAICNVLRWRNNQPAAIDLTSVEDTDVFRQQARAAYAAQAEKK